MKIFTLNLMTLKKLRANRLLKVFTTVLLSFILTLVYSKSWSQTDGDYQSNGSVIVTLSSSTNWQFRSGGAWIAATSAPSTASSGATITILAAATYDNTTACTIASGVTVVNQGGVANPITGGTVTMNGTYVHNTVGSASRVLGAMTFGTNSTMIFRGSSTLASSVSVAGRTFYHLKFESTSGTYPVAWSGGTAITVNGDLTLSSGVTVTNTTSGANVFAGNFTQNGTLTNSTNTQIYSFTGSGKTISGSGAISFETFNVNSGASITASSAMTLATSFTATIDGTFATAAAYTNSGTTNVNGTLQINSGGSISAAPVYSGTSTLIYNSGGSYGNSNEWTGAGTTPGLGVPKDVILQNNTTLTTSAARGLGGNLLVSSGSKFVAGGGTLAVGGTAAINGTFQINQGGYATGTFSYGASGTLIWNNTSGTYGPISGHSYYPATNSPANVSVLGAGGVDFGSIARTIASSFVVAATISNYCNLTLNGTVVLNSGYSFSGSCGSGPTYACNSALIYNSGGTPTRGGEWGTGTTPGNVTVTNNTTLNGNIGTGTICGGLYIETGSSLYMDYGSSGSSALNVGGTLSMFGNLSLGFNAPGDMTIGGDWNHLSGTFTDHGRAVAFNGASGDQTISRSGGETFAYLTINKAAGNVVMANNVTVSNTLTFTSGNLSIAGNTLTLNGAVTNTSGTFTGSSTSNLVIGGTAQGQTLNFTQTSASTRSLNNLTINASSTATLGSELDLYGTMTVTSSGTLNLNAKHLTLKSDANGTARIASLNSGGTNLTGGTDVTVERFIKLRSPGTGAGTGNNGRAYRLLAPTVNTSGTVRDNWMEGQNNALTGYSNNINTVPNYGTHITGAGGSSVGFDETTNNQSSLYLTTNGTTLTYTAVANPNGNLDALTGYFLFVRGDRSMDINLPATTGMPTSSTTLRTRGTLVTGTQTSFANTLIGGGALNLITNPYASPIDWSLVQPACTNVTTSYTLWDPNVGTRGGFVTVTTGGVVSGGGSATKFIQPGQAFFVESSGGVPTVSIQEGHKAAGNNNNVFRTTTTVESFRTELYFTEANGFRRIADGVVDLYDNSYSAGLDDNDAKEINNWDENIAIARENKHLAIESRPVINQRDTIPLFMNNMRQMNYEFQFIPENFTNIGLKAELIDNFLGTRTLLSVTNTVVVSFSVTADLGSSATNRFMIVFGPLAPLAIDITTIKAYQKNSGVQVEWTAKTETDMDHYEVERAFDGVQFSKQTTVAAIGNSSVAVNYSWYDAGAQTGNNFYRIKAIDRAGQIKYTTIVKVTIGKGQPAISVYPNPLSGNNLGLQLRNIEKGMYNITVFNNLGQKILSESVQHPGGSTTTMVVLPNSIIKGTYQLVLTGDNNVKLTTEVIKN